MKTFASRIKALGGEYNEYMNRMHTRFFSGATALVLYKSVALECHFGYILHFDHSIPI